MARGLSHFSNIHDCNREDHSPSLLTHFSSSVQITQSIQKVRAIHYLNDGTEKRKGLYIDCQPLYEENNSAAGNRDIVHRMNEVYTRWGHQQHKPVAWLVLYHSVWWFCSTDILIFSSSMFLIPCIAFIFFQAFEFCSVCTLVKSRSSKAYPNFIKRHRTHTRKTDFVFSANNVQFKPEGLPWHASLRILGMKPRRHGWGWVGHISQGWPQARPTVAQQRVFVQTIPVSWPWHIWLLTCVKHGPVR